MHSDELLLSLQIVKWPLMHENNLDSLPPD